MKTIYFYGVLLFSGFNRSNAQIAKPDILDTAFSTNMNVQDIYAALPQTLFYNLAKDGFTLYTGRAQWQRSDTSILVRIPITEGSNSYVYATKSVRDPQIKVYAIQYHPVEGTDPFNFTGTQMFIDFQEWYSYGRRFENGKIVEELPIVKLAEKDWEDRGMDNGIFGVDNNERFYIKKEGVAWPVDLKKFWSLDDKK